MTATAIKTTDGERFVLHDVSWDLYVSLRDDPTQTRVRMTYHRGVLELMSPSGPHEKIKRILEKFIDVWCEVHNFSMASFGSTTYRSEANKSGLEPDTCFYFENEPLVRNREDIDLRSDPPPDLAIEVDINSSSVGRLPIYAGLGVPEVWRTDGEWLKVYRLKHGLYEELTESEALPDLPLWKLTEFLARRLETDELTLIREFRVWAATQKPSA
jgi:Uma2 family endonuclease